MRNAFVRLAHEVSGAVAPTIALSLFGLIAAGGIAFDYARLASMDTELQDAADQAALAAATQLDGETGARARAISAARNLISNLTYFANDNGGSAVGIPDTSITFYSNYDPVTGAKGPVATTDDDAHYVLVTTAGRTANYALTPVVAALSSGQVTASAFATLDSAICNLPPFVMCAPSPSFNAADHVGSGMRLVIGSTSAPGNFGFLQSGFGSGANNLAKAIGWNGSAGGCIGTRNVLTEPGDKQSVRAAINTRFDISDSGQQCPAGGSCSPSTNSRKDLVHDNNGNNCTVGGNQGWRETDNPYRAPNTTPLSAANPMNATHAYPDIMGYPRDLCHAVSETGTCSGGRVGNGAWDQNAYFHVNYGWDNATWKTQTGLSDDPTAANYATRYKVYLWEAAHPTPTGAGNPGIGTNQQVTVAKQGGGKGGGNTIPLWASSWTGTSPTPQNVCRAPGVAPTNPDFDRRRTSIAVINCAGLTGRDAVDPTEWIDVFLVEPTIRRTDPSSAVRTDDGDVYVEIIGARPMPGVNQTVGNIVRRDVPRLIE